MNVLLLALDSRGSQKMRNISLFTGFISQIAPAAVHTEQCEMEQIFNSDDI